MYAAQAYLNASCATPDQINIAIEKYDADPYLAKSDFKDALFETMDAVREHFPDANPNSVRAAAAVGAAEKIARMAEWKTEFIQKLTDQLSFVQDDIEELEGAFSLASTAKNNIFKESGDSAQTQVSIKVKAAVDHTQAVTYLARKLTNLTNQLPNFDERGYWESVHPKNRGVCSKCPRQMASTDTS